MDAEFRIIQAKEFLRTTASGEYDGSKTLALLRRIAAKNKPPADHDLLIDTRLVTGPRLDYLDILQIVTLMERHRASFRNRIAFLVRSDALIDNIRFAERCAGTRDLSVRVFTDFEEAVLWLLHK